MLPDKMPPRGGFILPETLVLAGVRLRHSVRGFQQGWYPPLGRDSFVNVRVLVDHRLQKPSRIDFIASSATGNQGGRPAAGSTTVLR